MRLVLDTNVLIAALIGRGVCADLLEHCVLKHQLVTSSFILDEVARNLTRKFNYSEQEAREAVALFSTHMEVTAPQEMKRQVCRDAADDQIIGTALAGNARCIVTGDRDLLRTNRFENVDIVTPGDFPTYEATLS